MYMNLQDCNCVLSNPKEASIGVGQPAAAAGVAATAATAAVDASAAGAATVVGAAAVAGAAGAACAIAVAGVGGEAPAVNAITQSQPRPKGPLALYVHTHETVDHTLLRVAVCSTTVVSRRSVHARTSKTPECTFMVS